MWTFNESYNQEEKVLSWQDFPPDQMRSGEVTVPHIAGYLRRLLEDHEESEFIKYLVAPSPVALSGFFHCNESEIYDALAELQRQGYEAETNSNTEPVILWDPLIRRKTVRRAESNLWQHFYQMMSSPTGKQSLAG
jgi:hypothetical protein